MKGKQRTYMLIGVGVLALLALYRWQQAKAQQAAAAAQGGVPGGGSQPAATTSDYAALSGQEQSDVAALQSQNQQLLASTQASIAELLAQATQAAQEAGTTAAQGQLDALNLRIAQLGSGEEAINRVTVANVQIKPGSPFDKWYMKVTGKHAPANIKAGNWLYNAFKSGVPAAKLKAAAAKPSLPKGGIWAPFGRNKPAARKGYRTVGLGGGYWAYEK